MLRFGIQSGLQLSQPQADEKQHVGREPSGHPKRVSNQVFESRSNLDFEELKQVILSPAKNESLAHFLTSRVPSYAPQNRCQKILRGQKFLFHEAI